MLTRLSPSDYKRTPWKNGGGTSIDIAGDGDVWRFGRTPILMPGPFSDYAGHDRVQVLVQGGGLVLETPDGEIDVRKPFRPVRFDGATKIVSRLEAGPVEVVNLIGRRDAVKIDMTVREIGQTQPLAAGIDFAYAASGPVTLMVDGKSHALAPDHCLRIDSGNRTILAVMSGRVIVASIVPV